VFRELTKHIKIDCHIVGKKLKKGLIHLFPISTKEQLANISTKALSPQSFKSICSKLSFINICSTICGANKGCGYKTSRRKLILILSFLILSCFFLYLCLAFNLSFLILTFIGFLFYIMSL